MSTNSLIANHGYEAAERMGDFIQGRRSGIPNIVAFDIIRRVQIRGCRLKGSPVEAATKAFVEARKGTLGERASAIAALSAIQYDTTEPPGGIAGSNAVPCEWGPDKKTSR